MALLYRPLDFGEIRCMATQAAPELSPIRVTLLGSPPKDSMLAWTHSNAITCKNDWISKCEYLDDERYSLAYPMYNTY